mmetsp:Transcript_16535/g.34119  ORF Transcript_16535/g.34119 Transcript_16535/m.34119 type:complete len:90 (+) Transcript_16535:141-410(+)
MSFPQDKSWLLIPVLSVVCGDRSNYPMATIIATLVPVGDKILNDLCRIGNYWRCRLCGSLWTLTHKFRLSFQDTGVTSDFCKEKRHILK